MPRKAGTSKTKRARGNTEEEGESGAIVPVRLERDAYSELMGIKGILITQKRRNVSLSESVEELVRVFYQHYGKTPQIQA